MIWQVHYWLRNMKHMDTSKKQWILPLIIGASYIMPLGAVTEVLAQSSAPQVPTSTLSPNDPAAKLDPRLQNVPVKPAPRSSVNTLSTSSPVSPVTFDIQTRTTQVGSSASESTSSTSDSVRRSNPNYGVSTIITPEPTLPPTSGTQTESVIGQDNRVRITNTTTFPWRTITKLYVTFPNGKTYGCSGTLIAAKYVLTAGHCVHDPVDGGWVKKIEVIPGLNGTYKPYGSAFSTKVRSYTNWTSRRDSNYDFALVTLDRNIGNTTGWLGYGYYPSINGVTGHIAGYPGDKGNVYLYYHYGPILSSTAKRVSYTIDTAGGQSGSGVYRINNGNRYVFAVHTNGGTTTNSGTRIDSQKYNDLKAWIASGQ